MTRIFAHADYDFIGFRYKAIISTIVIFCVGVVAPVSYTHLTLPTKRIV